MKMSLMRRSLRAAADVAEVEQERAPFKFEVDVDAWIPEGIIDEVRIEARGHAELGKFEGNA